MPQVLRFWNNFISWKSELITRKILLVNSCTLFPKGKTWRKLDIFLSFWCDWIANMVSFFYVTHCRWVHIIEKMDKRISCINFHKFISKKIQTQLKHLKLLFDEGWNWLLSYTFNVVLSDSCNESIWTLGLVFCTIPWYKMWTAL